MKWANAYLLSPIRLFPQLITLMFNDATMWCCCNKIQCLWNMNMNIRVLKHVGVEEVLEEGHGSNVDLSLITLDFSVCERLKQWGKLDLAIKQQGLSRMM